MAHFRKETEMRCHNRVIGVSSRVRSLGAHLPRRQANQNGIARLVGELIKQGLLRDDLLVQARDQKTMSR
ncbi:MAG: hypothetical protein WD200_04175 [Candidatus Andersenbacteria bacterium]